MALVVLVGINIGATIHNPNYFVEIEMPVWIMAGLAVGLMSWQFEGNLYAGAGRAL